jgi:hypothetical protein
VDKNELAKLLNETRPVLIEAISAGVQEHVAALRARGIDFHAYALLPGEFDNLHDIVAVSSSLGDVPVPAGDSQYNYYRFSVDEWKNWHSDGFSAANQILLEANRRFITAHVGAGFVMDEVQVAFANGMLDSILCGLEQAKQLGTFEGTAPFLVIWISDSSCEIISKSVQRLNQPNVAADFMAEFG